MTTASVHFIENLATVLFLLGFIAIVLAAWLFNYLLGLLVLGASLISVAVVYDRAISKGGDN